MPRGRVVKGQAKVKRAGSARPAAGARPPFEPPVVAADLDPEVLLGCLELAPDLHMVAFVGTLARRAGLRYPVRGLKDLRVLFGAGDAVDFLGHAISLEQAQRYMRPEYFPITDERMLLSMVQLAFAVQNQERYPQMAIHDPNAFATPRRS